MNRDRTLLIRALPLLAWGACLGQPCEWAPDLSERPLDATFYVTSDSEIGRGRPVEEYVRYQQELIDFSRSGAVWPAGFRGAGLPMAQPLGVVTTGDNIFGGPGDEFPLIFAIQRLRFEWLWSRSRTLPPLDVFVDPTILDIEAIPYAVYAGLGNHDWDEGALQAGEATLLHHTRSVMPGCWGVTDFHAPSGNYSWNWGRLHLVQLNEWAGEGERGGLEWLRQDLGRVGPDAPVILFQHFGFDGFSRQARWWTDTDRAAFLDLVCDHNVLGLFSGHTHHAFPSDRNTVSCPSGKRLALLRNFIGEDGILFNFDGTNGYFGDAPQGTGTFMVVRVVDDGTPDGSFMDVATVSWTRGAASGTELRTSRNGYDFIQSLPIETEAPGSFRNLDLGPWRSLQGALLHRPAPALLPDGRAAVFAVRTGRAVWLREESSEGVWSDWTSLGGRSWGEPAAGRLADGRSVVFVKSDFGAIRFAVRRTDGSWTAWERLGSFVDAFASVPVVVSLRDGRPQLFAVDGAGRLHWNLQEAGGGWGPWRDQGGPVDGAGSAGIPAVVRTDDGRLAVFVRGTDQKLHVNHQLAEYGVWSGWRSLSSRSSSGDPAAVAAGDEIHVFAHDAGTKQIWNVVLSPEALTVTGEGPIEALEALRQAPVAAVDGNGDLRLLARREDSNLSWNRRKAGAGQSWQGWNRLPRRTVLFRPAILALPDGRLQVHAVQPAGAELLYAPELRSWSPD